MEEIKAQSEMSEADFQAAFLDKAQKYNVDCEFYFFSESFSLSLDDDTKILVRESFFPYVNPDFVKYVADVKPGETVKETGMRYLKTLYDNDSFWEENMWKHMKR